VGRSLLRYSNPLGYVYVGENRARMLLLVAQLETARGSRSLIYNDRPQERDTDSPLAPQKDPAPTWRQRSLGIEPHEQWRSGLVSAPKSFLDDHIRRWRKHTTLPIAQMAEFDFRYSSRIALGIDNKARAGRALKGIVGKRLTYSWPAEIS
jgi:hypothetical protein